MEKKPLLSVTEVAKLLKLTRQTVLARIKAGTLRAQKVGATYIIAKRGIKK